MGSTATENRDKIREVVKDKNLTWRSFWNDSGADGKISDAWRIQGWPTIFILDDKGVIRYKNVRGDQLDDAIVKLLDEMGHQVKLDGHDEHGTEP